MKDRIIEEGNKFIQFVFEKECECKDEDGKTTSGHQSPQFLEAQKNQHSVIEWLKNKIFEALDEFQDSWDLWEKEKQKGLQNGNNTSTKKD